MRRDPEQLAILALLWYVGKFLENNLCDSYE